MTKAYRCYFTDDGDRIRSYEQIECADDATAALKAEELLRSSRYSTAELWEGKRLVGKWTNGAGKTEVSSSQNSVSARATPLTS